jgi:hypothetical protein
MLRMQAALIALLGVSATVPPGSPGLGMGLVVVGSFLGALTLLFGSCLLTGWIGARRIAEPNMTRALHTRAASTRALGRETASQRLTA